MIRLYDRKELYTLDFEGAKALIQKGYIILTRDTVIKSTGNHNVCIAEDRLAGISIRESMTTGFKRVSWDIVRRMFGQGGEERPCRVLAEKPVVP